MTLFLKIPIKYYYLEKCNNPQEDWVFFFLSWNTSDMNIHAETSTYTYVGISLDLYTCK